MHTASEDSLRIMGRGLVILHLHFALFVCYLLDSKYTYNIHMFTTKNLLDEGNEYRMKYFCIHSNKNMYRISAITTRPLIEPEPRIVPEF